MRILQVAFLLLFNYLDSLPKLYYDCDKLCMSYGNVRSKAQGFFGGFAPPQISRD